MLSQKILAEKELLSNIKQNKTQESKLKYTFEMLLTDDSTDDEDKVTSHRPAPPAWSLRECWLLILKLILAINIEINFR